MTNQSVASQENTKAAPGETTTYFGLPVEVIARLPHYSSIRYGNRVFVVESVDLRTIFAMERAA